MTLQEFIERKEIVERLRREADRKAGSLELLKKQLRDQFGCTVEKAAKLLEQKKQEVKKLEIEANESWEQFQEKWMEKLQ